MHVEAAQDYGIDLVATFLPKLANAHGAERQVAGVQSVDTNVYIDFNRDLPLWWLAQVQRRGEIAPNRAMFAYAGDADQFHLLVTPDVRLAHDAAGWHVPAYDTTRYQVTVGFALGNATPACLVAAPPLSTVLVGAGGYQLARSSGGQLIGDVILPDQPTWTMPLGGSYLLWFDSLGVGHLSIV